MDIKAKAAQVKTLATPSQKDTAKAVLYGAGINLLNLGYNDLSKCGSLEAVECIGIGLVEMGLGVICITVANRL